MKFNKYLLITAIGFLMLISPMILALQTVEYMTVTAKSPVEEGEISTINIRVKADVGISGKVNLFIDEVFYQSMGGMTGSDGIMYFSMGWVAKGIGSHTVRAVYFEGDDPIVATSASTTIRVVESDQEEPEEPPDNGDGSPPDDGDGLPPDNGGSSFSTLPFQIAGLGLIGFGGYKLWRQKRR